MSGLCIRCKETIAISSDDVCERCKLKAYKEPKKLKTLVTKQGSFTKQLFDKFFKWIEEGDRNMDAKPKLRRNK